jgi:hypothetical protein
LERMRDTSQSATWNSIQQAQLHRQQPSKNTELRFTATLRMISTGLMLILILHQEVIHEAQLIENIHGGVPWLYLQSLP